MLACMASAELAVWTTQLEHAPFSARAMPAGGVHNGTFYVMGGANKFHVHLESDIWKSVDGLQWERVTRHADFGARGYYETSILKNGTMVMTGGQTMLDCFSDVWVSHDSAATWTKILDNAPWGYFDGESVGRSGHKTLVLEDDTIVLFAGSHGIFKRRFFGDVWVSRDGGHSWLLRYDPRMQAATWSPGSRAVVETNGTIYIMGGDSDDYVAGINRRYSDVWRSEDMGSSWELVGNAPWGNRTGLQCVSVDGKCIHCIGGNGNPECNQGKATLFADVWKTCDGANTWKRVSNNGFGCDGTVQCNNCGADDMLTRVKDGKVWMFAADREKAAPFPMSNSVWTLEDDSLIV